MFLVVFLLLWIHANTILPVLLILQLHEGKKISSFLHLSVCFQTFNNILLVKKNDCSIYRHSEQIVTILLAVWKKIN